MLTPMGSKPVEEFRPGDLILSRPEWDSEAPVEAKVVEEVFVRTGRIWHLRVGGKVIRTTGEHPFFVKRAWKFLAVQELEVGDLLLSKDGQWVAVEEVYDTGEYETVYNLRVADFCTYFVGDVDWGFSVWAHNMCQYPTTEAERQQLADRLTQKGLVPTQSRRKMVKAKIEQMAKDMESGSFDWNASACEPIQLTPTNEVYGGHHRMIAAEIAGVDILNMPGQSIRLGVSSGVRANFSWIDALPLP